MIGKQYKSRRFFGDIEREELRVRVFPDRVEITDMLLTELGTEEIGYIVLSIADWREIKGFVEEVIKNEI